MRDYSAFARHHLRPKCAKQTTIAILVNNGRKYVGSNWCTNPQKECPRGNMKTGVGYEMCEYICEQNSHAEIDAINKAGKDALGATMFLIGHSYACDQCQKKIDEFGIDLIIIDNLVIK